MDTDSWEGRRHRKELGLVTQTIIPALKKLRKDSERFHSSLGHTVKPHLTKKKIIEEK